MSALKKCLSILNKARVDEGLSDVDKKTARASRHSRYSNLSGKVVGGTSRTQMEQGVHRPTSGKNYGFTESSRLGDMVRRHDDGAKLEIKGTHKRLKNIKPKLVKAIDFLNKARVDEGKSIVDKQKMRESRNQRESVSNFIPNSKQAGNKNFMRHGKTVGTPKNRQEFSRGVHDQVQHGKSTMGLKVRDKEFDSAKRNHARVAGEMKNIRPKLAKAIEFLALAKSDEYVKGVHVGQINSKSGTSLAGTKARVLTRHPDMGMGHKKEAIAEHKRVLSEMKKIKPKLVKAMQWLEQNDLQKGENDELAFHAERARAAQYANKNAIAKEHFLAFLKLATEQCKIASSIWGMRSLFNKTLDYYLDLADTKIYANNQNEISNGTNDAALVIYFKNGGKFENYKG